MKLNMINQILNVNNHILAIYPSTLIIFGFYEVIKCYSETSPLPCFSSFVNDENSIIFQDFRKSQILQQEIILLLFTPEPEHDCL